MLLKELYYYYKSNKLVICVLIIQIAVLFILLGTFLAFSSEVSYGKGNLEKIYGNKAIYSLIDGYFDPDEFEEFREQEESLEIIKNFYIGLNAAQGFQYLAMFNQEILVHDIDNMLPDREVLEDGTVKRMTSFQMNKQAHDYFGLTVSEGRLFSAEDFNADKKVISVLVGNNCSDNIDIGDKLEAVYYQKEITLEVVGILSPNKFLYFNGDPEFYLDNYIILPYINYTDPKTDFDEWFQKIVYFSMINGYISIPDDSKSASRMMIEIEAIAQQSGFYNYLFIGTNPNTQPYRGLINVISANYELVQLLFVLSFLLNLLLITFQLCLFQKRRLSYLAIHYLHGASITYLMKQYCIEISTIMFLAFIISQAVLSNILKISTNSSLFKLSICAIIFILGISTVPIYKLKKIELISLLNSEEAQL